MDQTDLSDVSGVAYTYLMNGTPPAGNWTAIARPGERVRLRFIGAGTATYFDVRVPGLKLLVVSTDGQRVEPVEVDEFRIGPGETYDVLVQLPDERAYTIFAQSMDRTGFARGTLAPRPGMAAQVPAVDPRVWLDPVDMMGAMAMMSGRGNHGGKAMAMAGKAMAMGAREEKVRHARTEYGPGVDMRVDHPRTNLDDPGVGLRRNGRRVLTYADLRTVGGALDRRGPGREIELHLTGNMERFMWSIDGVKLNDAKPVHFRKGERLRVTLHNDTTMWHPMHLHGMWSELELTAYVAVDDGTVSARLKGSYDLRLTNRLILTPELETNVTSQAHPDRAIGVGWTNIELAVRLRYEIVRKLAPYVGFDWDRALFDTVDKRLARGQPVSDARLVAGLRLWW